MNERWSDDLPRCDLVKCPALNVHLSPHLRMECTSGNLFRSTCNFMCDVGWELRGDDQIECQAGGEWNGQIPYCQLITCGNLKAPEHGRISCSNRDRYDSKCSYECDTGYELIGAQKTVCQSDSKWSAPGPTCSRVSCGALDAPANGRLECTGDNELFGTRCEAICNEGFKLTDGDRIRICQDTTLWSGEPAQCSQIKCPLLSAPKHGRRLCSNSNLYGSKCRFVCEIGYEFHGNQERICQANEMWSGREASCSIKQCIEVPK